MQPLRFAHATLTTCLGKGLQANWTALRAGRSGLSPCAFETVDLATWIGEVADLDAVVLPAELARFDCRNNRLAWLALQQDGFFETLKAVRAQHGAQRLGVFLGTSTSGILQTELAYRQRDPDSGALPASFHYAETHNTYSVAHFVRSALALSGPAVVVSTACSSSAKVFASAARMIECGLIDAAIVGGVDSLCLTTLYGFNSLELLSPEPCQPYSAERRGLSIGEAAAFVLLERTDAAETEGDSRFQNIRVLGVGESSDAHHMSAPHPEGRGAQLAMSEAMQQGGVSARDIGYINLHGTATPSNDAAEGKAVAGLFGRAVPCSSTKGATGHTLGAAGGVEAIFTALSLEHGCLPAGIGSTECDPQIDIDYLLAPRERSITYALNNSFGFGGSNCSLLLGREITGKAHA